MVLKCTCYNVYLCKHLPIGFLSTNTLSETTVVSSFYTMIKLKLVLI